MSRIDEALRRTTQNPSSRGAGRVVDAPTVRANERTLDEYPPESKSSDDRGERDDRERVEHQRAERSTGTRNRVSNAAAAETKPVARQNPDGHTKLVVGPDRNPMSVEQYRRLAAALHDAQVERGLKTVVITSAMPKEGKTLTAVNLALTFSESYGRRVLLIDADLRRPSVHEIFGISNDRGLSDALRSDRVDIPTIQVSPLLSVLPSGRPDHSPLAGLSSERMRILLDETAGHFDWIILDTPPLGLLSDAQLLTRLTQAAVFVVRAGSTPYEAIDRAINELGRENVIGTVLNGVEEDAIPATGYYGDYYGHTR